MGAELLRKIQLRGLLCARAASAGMGRRWEVRGRCWKGEHDNGRNTGERREERCWRRIRKHSLRRGSALWAFTYGQQPSVLDWLFKFFLTFYTPWQGLSNSSTALWVASTRLEETAIGYTERAIWYSCLRSLLGFHNIGFRQATFWVVVWSFGVHLQRLDSEDYTRNFFCHSIYSLKHSVRKTVNNSR